MSVEIILVLATLLPLVATISAKAGASSFSNHAPRQWLAQQQGWRARANAAQANSFEALPFFYAAVLYSTWKEAPLSSLQLLAAIWLVLRLLYIALYIWDKALLRSLVWFLALVVNVVLLFS